MPQRNVGKPAGSATLVAMSTPAAAPDLAVFVGLQASGKTSFYRAHLAATHVHVSKDLMPHNRRRQARQRELIAEALAAGRSVAVDNTNPTRVDRVPLIEIARAHGAGVTGYVFLTTVDDAIARNTTRTGRAQVPLVGILSTAKRLETPTADEGYDALFSVELRDGAFLVQPWTPNAAPPLCRYGPG